ncbi:MULTISPECIES: DUF502 domain-containing protein [Idiomarina]|jgi:uncharacterized membrane protein|uniref:DUF502 domain-containing protein n=1 Tax=Idiomarina abyssalis TaxID=86102 RepID=A0A8I1GCC3_9GAMM|nr:MULTISPECIES: DUF502 domain-containing protein [Idiomarina]KPD20359.1 membrane protein [Idiomarina abyssalis]MAB21659.1 DUF502 domain-containing protein [Idiomarina sp.]MAO69361.1 DUF502 domain-containing protein [Idiomarina sp.]MBJ7267019.1 DUF502 domain-containing protein [Idiomarina abyssalis]MBJ7273706.1 DUF502 domain-containing protein [Idiomarina abyssalis]|tara:strand:+ start:107 stop:712 length:606 start_codon:yes stop_codon:yes gene_type:complete
MKRTLQYLFKGLAILLPIVVTFALLQWLLVTIETWLKPIWTTLLGESSYFPGLAFISFLAIALLIGFSSRWNFIDSLWQLPGKLMNRLPLLRSLYGTINDVFEMMSGKNFAEESVVLVTLPGSNLRLIGIVTKKSGIKGDRLSELMKEDQVAVFLPMSYNVGGYMVIVPGDCVESLTMKPADALQLTISGGLGKNHSGKTD